MLGDLRDSCIIISRYCLTMTSKYTHKQMPNVFVCMPLPQFNFEKKNDPIDFSYI